MRKTERLAKSSIEKAAKVSRDVLATAQEQVVDSLKKVNLLDQWFIAVDQSDGGNLISKLISFFYLTIQLG